MMLNNALLPHQKEAVDKLIKLKVGALFMEQGTGKTITALEIGRIRLEAGKIDSIIWLCPCSAKKNIKQEIHKQCPYEYAKNILICGIETLSSSVRAYYFLLQYAKNHKCFLVVDESLLVKNPEVYRTKHITEIAGLCPYRMILNGTPISRNEADLFAQFYILDWRILGYRTYWKFAANHLEYDQYGKIRAVLDTKYLAEKISPYTFQVKKEDCLELPPKSYRTAGFWLTEEQEALYDETADELLGQVDEFEPETIYRLFSALQAVTSGKRIDFVSKKHYTSTEFFSDPMDNPRIQKLLEILPDEKTIIFCRCESEITQLCGLLPDAVRFDGRINQTQRNEALRAFRAEKKYLVANKNCAGFSLNLQFCHNIVYMSNDWELGKRLQSEDRVHRIGQQHGINIIDIFAYNTLDIQVLKCLRKKERLLDSIQEEIGEAQGNGISVLKNYIYGGYGKEIPADMGDLNDG